MGGNNIRKVLMVEDNESVIDLFKVEIEDMDPNALVLAALNQEKAEELFLEHPDIFLIIMDACVPGVVPNTMGLVSKMRQIFKGPIIATSSNVSNCQPLIEAGCNFHCDKAILSQQLTKFFPP